MINPGKLFQLEPGQKRRKLALTFGELERDIAGIAEHGTEYNFPGMTRAEYTKTVVRIVMDDPKLPESAAEELKKLIEAEDFDERRVCNFARNSLLAIIGTFPAEWDLVIAPHSNENLCVQSRKFFKGISVYAEDIRSPFNIGSIFRTAEAMGCENVFISPNCTDPNQPRALRSGMGCIAEFSFPKEGIVIIGSEELGVSPEALKRADYGRVSIPMTGLKASLNVGVAFGILMQAWVQMLSD